MLEEILEIILPEVVSLFELFGVLVIIIGAFKSVYHYIRALTANNRSYFRLEFANALALGLEFKMAAEIINTVLIRDINEILILGSIILLRALLTLLIHWEIKTEQQH